MGPTIQNCPTTQMINDFNEFKKSLQGKNPNEILNNVMNSGKYSQAQFEKAKQMAQQFSALLK